MVLASIGSAAVSALFGAIGGALITIFAAYIRRAEEDRARALRLLAAARLVDEELRNAFDAAEAILAGEPWVTLPVSAWEREGVRLAAGVGLAEWAKVARAYDRVNGFNWRFEAKLLEDKTVRDEICRKITEDVPGARDVLGKYIESSPDLESAPRRMKLVRF